MAKQLDVKKAMAFPTQGACGTLWVQGFAPGGGEEEGYVSFFLTMPFQVNPVEFQLSPEKGALLAEYLGEAVQKAAQVAAKEG